MVAHVHVCRLKRYNLSFSGNMLYLPLLCQFMPQLPVEFYEEMVAEMYIYDDPKTKQYIVMGADDLLFFFYTWMR